MNQVTKNESPESTRLPADISLSNSAAAAAGHVEGRRHLNAVLHEHHAAGFGHDGLAGIERDDHALQVIADEL